MVAWLLAWLLLFCFCVVDCLWGVDFFVLLSFPLTWFDLDSCLHAAVETCMRPKLRGAHFCCSRVDVVIILLCKVQGFFAIGRRFDQSPKKKKEALAR